ncbi:MAG: ATP-binding protein [Candidatus Woesearchaeota archaeon]
MVYVKRELLEPFSKRTEMYRIVAVVGPRQAGKTTFLKQQASILSAKYVFFDDPDARNLFEEDIKRFAVQYMSDSLTVLDEVQYCVDAGSKLKYLADAGYTFWITSSSETLLAKEVLSYLVGRVSILRLYPFSLTEYLRSVGQKEYTEVVLRRNIFFHCVYGGYPKIVLEPDIDKKKILLSDLKETMILKDVAQTFSIQDVASLERFVRFLAYNATNMISYTDVCSDTGLSYPTVKKYEDALEKSYVISPVSPYFTNKQKEISKQPKIYFYDTGLRNSIAGEFVSELTGDLFENYVFCELIKNNFSVKYWRSKTKQEVDFVLETSSGLVGIEVKLQFKKKHLSSLRSFIRMHNPSRCFVVTYKGSSDSFIVDGCEVLVCNIQELFSQLLASCVMKQ